MNHQDWNNIIINNPAKLIQSLPKEIVERKGNMSLQNHLNKIENETEKFTIKTIPNELSKEIMQARTSKKMTQKDIAIKLNIQQNALMTSIQINKNIIAKLSSLIINLNTIKYPKSNCLKHSTNDWRRSNKSKCFRSSS